MELPRDSSDICVCFACPVCNGSGGFGIRSDTYQGKQTSNFNPCSTCNGSGWHLRKPAELTAVELSRLTLRLPKP